MASRPTLQVFQTLGLMPTPPARTEHPHPPPYRTAVRSGPAPLGVELGAAPAGDWTARTGNDAPGAERGLPGER